MLVDNSKEARQAREINRLAAEVENEKKKTKHYAERYEESRMDNARLREFIHKELTSYLEDMASFECFCCNLPKLSSELLVKIEALAKQEVE